MTVTTSITLGLPIVAVADLHGHRRMFDALVARLDQDLASGYVLVTLGDYVDNGPEIPELLDRLVALKAERPERFFPIIGNHDLACLRAIGYRGAAPDPTWYRQWSSRYWNPGLGTARAYGADSAESLAAKMPSAHREFLEQLPWYLDRDGFLFVHAGLEDRDLEPQLAELEARRLLPGTHTQPQLRSKDLARVSTPRWGRVVVSGHTQRPGSGVAGQASPPHFSAAHRIVLSAEVDHGGDLWAVVLPERRLYSVDHHNHARERQ